MMTTDPTQTNLADSAFIPFGARLKAAREVLGLERKEAAAQLRLSEKVILMMEKENYPSDLPITFIRGYIRAYGKLLDIPEHEIRKAIEPIKPKPIQPEFVVSTKHQEPVTSGNYFMQIFTYLIIFTMLGLVCAWWYSHSYTPRVTAEHQLASLPDFPNPAPSAPTSAATATIPTPAPAATANAAPVAAPAQTATTSAPTATPPVAAEQNRTLNTADIQATTPTAATPKTKITSKHKNQVIVEDLSDATDDNNSDSESDSTNTKTNSDYAD